MHDCHRSSKMVQQLVSIILSKLKWMVEILLSQSPEDCSREIFTGFHISLLIRSETCLFLSKGMRLRFQKYTQMCLFWNSVAAPDTLYVPSLYYPFSDNNTSAPSALPLSQIWLTESFYNQNHLCQSCNSISSFDILKIKMGIRRLLGIHHKSLIVLARQNKLWKRINSMAIIESEMISHSQHVLSSIGQQPLPQG